MGGNLQQNVGAFIKPSLVAEIDEMRGQIPRSRIIERALVRFVDDVKSGKVNLLEGPQTMNQEGPAATAATTATLGGSSSVKER